MTTILYKWQSTPAEIQRNISWEHLHETLPYWVERDQVEISEPKELEHFWEHEARCIISSKGPGT